MTVSESISQYLVYLSAEKGDSLKTLEAYKTDLFQFSHFVNDKESFTLTSDDFTDFLIYLNSEKHFQKKTLIRKGMAIRGFYFYLKNEEIINVNMCDIELPKDNIRIPEVLTEDEINRLFQMPDIDSSRGLMDLAMMELAYGCGLRVSELVSLKTTSMSLKSGYLKIKGKGSKERIVPFGREAMEAVLDYQEKVRNGIPNAQKSKFLFLHKDGRNVTRQYFFLRLKKYCQEAGINKKISPHTLRHSFATRLLENGAQFSQIQMLLGHSRIETTQIYAHVSNAKVLSEYEKAVKR
ncbi:MAG: tyrosine recombinase [Bacilli bacterium]